MRESDPQEKAEFRERALNHLDALYGLGLRLTGGDEERAGDLVQEAMLEACRSRASFEVGTNGRAWLMTILRDTFIEAFRERQGRPSRVGHGQADERPVGAELQGVDPAGASFERLTDDAVVRAIEELDDELRIALVLTDLEGLAYAEVAEALEIPVGTAKSLLFRARQRLQRELFGHARETGNVS